MTVTTVSRHARASRLAGHFVPRSLFEVSHRSTSLLLGHALPAVLWASARAGERARRAASTYCARDEERSEASTAIGWGGSWLSFGWTERGRWVDPSRPQ